VGQPLPADLHIYMPANQNLLLFRKKGDTLSEKDLETTKKITDGNLIVLKAEFEAFLLAMRGIAIDSIASNPSSPEAVASATTVLRGLGTLATKPGETPEETFQKTKKILDDSFNFVKEILAKCKTTPAGKSFFDALKNVEKDSSPLLTHCRHVSALSTLALIAVGVSSIEELADIAFAGLIHDQGMADIPQILLEKHLAGIPVEGLTGAEKITVMRHIDFVFEQLKKSKTFVPDGARRIVEHHHENWSGSGFKGLKEEQIFRSARVMRIIDDLVTYIQNPDSPQDIKQAFAIVREMSDLASNLPQVDPKLLAKIEQTVFA
jgi:HD-GYP domain-containing protein (c-di-GMP phosphodiesterase class II)